MMLVRGLNWRTGVPCWLSIFRDHREKQPSLQRHNGALAWYQTVEQFWTWRCQCGYAMPHRDWRYVYIQIQGHTVWTSHYSLQYGDGMLGPLTIHGPATANYDRPVDPILMTDWNHRSAFMDFQKELGGTGPPKMDSILLNGIGTWIIIVSVAIKSLT